MQINDVSIIRNYVNYKFKNIDIRAHYSDLSYSPYIRVTIDKKSSIIETYAEIIFPTNIHFIELDIIKLLLLILASYE